MVRNLVSEFVKEAPPYVVGVSETGIVNRPGVTEIIQLATNENPFGISPLAEKAMIAEASRGNRYPDVRATTLRVKLAKKHGLSPDNVIVTEGATQALNFIGEVFIREGDEIILSSPTYPNYYNVIKRMRGTLVDVPMAEDYIINFDDVSRAITPKTKVIFICNPNNPTGTIADDKKMLEFIRKAPKHLVVVVDEAYIDFVADGGYQSMICAIDDSANLLVVRTFSKIYGMAGCRIGYTLANKEIIDYLQCNATGFCCNRMGMFGAEAALDDAEFAETTKRLNAEGRDYLTRELTGMGFKVWPSSSNFIYFDARRNPGEFADALMNYGILIRGNFAVNRISVGTMEQNRKAAAAMKDILAKG
ncbi:MAG: histidinol-phosphate transaminase [Treponema sp.]|jgi:histidinol-phosphate aminotransferase|nr:histidinol-phosphate transaminase [Treponema sp.]